MNRDDERVRLPAKVTRFALFSREGNLNHVTVFFFLNYKFLTPFSPQVSHKTFVEQLIVPIFFSANHLHKLDHGMQPTCINGLNYQISNIPNVKF